MNLRSARGRIAAVLTASALALGVLSVPTASTAASGTLTFTFYDRNGSLLTATQVHAIAIGPGTGVNQGYDADAFLNPATLEMVGSPNPLGSGLSAALPSSPASVYFAMNWLASPSNGYSLVILDNAGAGFTSTATVNFTYRAAKDAKARLDAGLATRTSPAYTHSAAFDTAYNSAVSYLALADATGATQATKGKNGALALEQLVDANNLMLKEYGTAYANANTAVADRWNGFTMDETQAGGTTYKTPMDRIVSMTASTPAVQAGWVRVVMDPTLPVSTYANEITYAHQKGLKVLAEPVDSAYCDASNPTPGFTCSATAYHDVFVNATTQLTGNAAPDAFEVGNEINGDWVLSTGANPAAARVADAAAVVTANAPGKLRVLTLYYQINTAGSAQFSQFNWARTNLTPAIRANIDVVLLSTYIEQAPLGLAFDQVMRQMQTEFPGKKIGLGELGYWIPDQRYWWAFSNLPSTSNPTTAQLKPIADQYYRAAFGYADSVGGGFWWNYPTEVYPSADFRCQFAQIRADFGGGTCGNTHTGTWAGRGQLPATAAFKDLHQAVTVTPNTTATASVWIKGTGSVKLNVWGNTAWTTNLATMQCTAAITTWTQCAVPNFAIGNRTTVYLDFENAYDGAGTIYLDDAFLGQPTGTNLLTNPGFESGNTAWSSTSSTIWSIVQP